jgi:hypothetical protein
MFRKLMLSIAVILSIGLIGCDLRTPEIRGVVLDAETKQPVEAWIHATIWVNIKTLAGSTGKVISLDPPHTRSDKSGKFSIPRKEISKPPFPMGFGTKVEKFTIGAATIDKGGQIEVNVKDLEKGKIEVTLHLDDLEKAWQKELKHVPPEKYQQEKEMREFSSLQSFYNYCFTGRFSVETPTAEGGCDDWELNYVIAKHERYLGKYKENVKGGFYNALDQLADLYRKNNNYEKAVEALRQRIDYIERQGLLKYEIWQRNKATVERKINEIQKEWKKHAK